MHGQNIHAPDEEDLDLEDNEQENEVGIENIDANINHDAAIESFGICIQWAQQNNIEYTNQMLLSELQKKAIDINLNIPKKQTFIHQFFKQIFYLFVCNNFFI